MSHHRGLQGAPLQRNQHPLPIPTRSKSKRLRTKRERNAAKFGPKVTLGGSRQRPAVPPRRLQPPLWGGLPLGSPLCPPKPVVITENRLCRRGLFNREVKSLDVRRLLTPGPAGDGHTPAPQTEEGEVGGVLPEVLKELVESLASLLGSFGAFLGRELASERRRSLVAVLRRHHWGLPDLRVFLAQRTLAQLPAGPGTPQTPRQEARPGPPGRAVSLPGWEVEDPYAGTPSPPRAVFRAPLPPHAPSPIYGAPGEQETPFLWSSAEDEDDEIPRGLPQNRGAPGGLVLGSPQYGRSPQPPQEEEEEEEEGGDEGRIPIAPPTFSPDPPPWERYQSRDPCWPPRAPRAPHTPQVWRLQMPRDPVDPSRPSWDTSRALCGTPRYPWDSLDSPQPHSRPLWELSDTARDSLGLPRAPWALQMWSPEPPRAPPSLPRPLCDPLKSPRLLRDARPWSPDPPRGALDPPRAPWAPQVLNPASPRAVLDAARALWSPPRPHRELPDVSRPPWYSPAPPRVPLDPLRSPRASLFLSPQPLGDPPRSSREPRDPSRPPRDPRPWRSEPSGATQSLERSRCCCRGLCRDRAQRDLLCRHIVRRDLPRQDTFHRAVPRPAPLCRDIPCPDPPHCYQRLPKRCRADRWAVLEGSSGDPGDSPPSPLLPSGCGCSCRGVCLGAGFETRRGL